jgi:hypothetical protein
MAAGFAQPKKTKVKNFKTIFERMQDKSGEEEKPLTWYTQTLKSMAAEYKINPDHLNRDEKRDRNDAEDNQDNNHLRRFPRIGRLYFFEYKASMKYLPYYDTFPLVYVIKTNPDSFFGANLHYMHPKKRLIAIEKLRDGRIDIPRVCFHKYILDHVNGFLLDLAQAEWETSIAIPVEHFVKPRGKVLVPYKSSEVWAETQKTYSDRLKAKRIIKGYGKPSDIEEVS